MFPRVIPNDRFIEGVTGVLRAFDDRGESLSPVRPIDFGSVPPGTITAVGSPERDNPFHSLDFLLRDFWTSEGRWRLRVELQVPPGTVDANLANNSAEVAVQFVAAPNWPEVVGIAYLPICTARPGGGKPDCPTSNINFRTEFVDKLYPVPDNAISYFPLPVPPKIWPKPVTSRPEFYEVRDWLVRYFNLIDSPPYADTYEVAG